MRLASGREIGLATEGSVSPMAHVYMRDSIMASATPAAHIPGGRASVPEAKGRWGSPWYSAWPPAAAAAIEALVRCDKRRDIARQ